MSQIDRLSSLMNSFALSVRPAPIAQATLVGTCAEDGQPAAVMFQPRTPGFGRALGQVHVSAKVDWGGDANPLIAALPARIVLDLEDHPDTASLVRLLQAELVADRCGSESVVNRLGEVLVVRLMRLQIEIGTTEPGLLAGLADPRLSRAIVAIHEDPSRAWRNEDLAEVAGLSLSRFAQTFTTAVGETPAAYLRRWRLTLARQDVLRGGRVDRIARQYGYGSPEGFTRAFKRQFGVYPMALRPRSGRGAQHLGSS